MLMQGIIDGAIAIISSASPVELESIARISSELT